MKYEHSAIANAKNPYQGNEKKVLCVCSAGMMRSATTAVVLNRDYNYNTRAVGVNKTYALIPINTQLLYWADEIVCAEWEHAKKVMDLIDECMLKEDAEITKNSIKILNIPDTYGYMDEDLINLIRANYVND